MTRRCKPCRVAEVARERGLTLGQVAALCGVGPDRLYRLARGDRPPRPEEVLALSECLRVEPAVLWPPVRVGHQGAAAALVALFSSREGEVLAGALWHVLKGVVEGD